MMHGKPEGQRPAQEERAPKRDGVMASRDALQQVLGRVQDRASQPQSCEDFQPLMMGLMDQELTPEESVAVNDHLTRCQSCREEFEHLRESSGRLASISFIEPTDEVLEGFWKHPYNALERNAGIYLVLGGLATLLLYGGYLFTTSFSWELFLTGGGVVISWLAMAALFLRQRLRTSKTDPYKDRISSGDDGRSRTLVHPLSMAAFILAFLVSGLASGEAAEPTLELTACSEELDVTGAQCGTLDVYEDRAAGTGRRIALHVAVLPALGNETLPDPLFMLAGGPGQAASELADLAEHHLRRIRNHREIVLVDQRGTGDSNNLDCGVDADSTYFSLDADSFVDAMRDCLAGLDADLRLYTTPIAMDDLEDVRVALGYDSINLWGGSYGTRAVLVYLRRHEEHVRTVIVDGLAPPAIRLPLWVGEDAHRALELVFRDCAADRECNAAQSPRIIPSG